MKTYTGLCNQSCVLVVQLVHVIGDTGTLELRCLVLENFELASVRLNVLKFVNRGQIN